MWGRRRRSDEDFAQEVRAHLEIEADRLIAEGCDPREAHDAARRRFGNVLSAQERFHESTRWVWLEQTLQDVRYAWRGLRANPAFAATAMLTLAVGLALVTVIFAVFNAYVLRPFAVRDPTRCTSCSGARRTTPAAVSSGATTRSSAAVAISSTM